jgi:hypothetical protein
LNRYRSKGFLVAGFVAAAGAAVLIGFELTARTLWVDEEMLALNARDRAFTNFGSPLWLDQSVPLGWLAAERLVILTFGTGERSVRAVTTLFGIATLAAATWVGRRWMTPAGAAILAIVCATGQWLVFFTLELKHYSADAFGALLLPALAAWALETSDGEEAKRRLTWWWAVAAVALWFSNGALFVTPGCALILAVLCWRRHRQRAIPRLLIGGSVWLLSFAIAYTFQLRFARTNPYLRQFWAFAFPPASQGFGALVGWAGSQLEPMAIKPGGTSHWIAFWVAWTIGISAAILRRRELGLMFAAVPLSALALALFHVVPIFERLAVWTVPALYVGVACCADASVALLPMRSRRRAGTFLLALVAAIASIIVTNDVAARGIRELNVRPRSNYGLDDRRSIRAVMTLTRPADVVATTHFGLAGLWWYANISVFDPAATGRLPNGAPILQLGHEALGPGCASQAARASEILRPFSRLVVYLGFRMNVLPPGFDRLVLKEFGQRGELVHYLEHAEGGRVAIFDLSRREAKPLVVPGESLLSSAPSPIAEGCVTLTPARRW